jgi:DNA-binding transcriptional LysR family regulator
MPAHHPLSAQSLTLLATIARQGSFAAAARELGLVPSSLTYRVRQIEDELDLLLFDRSARQARPTPAGLELLREGQRLLADMDAVANRVRRIATGWEPELTLAVDSLIVQATVLDLCQQFFALPLDGSASPGTSSPPTRIRLRGSTLNGTLELLSSGQVDLALGAVSDSSAIAGLRSRTLGTVDFVFALAPQHPLAHAAEPLSDELLRQHRLVVVADSAQQWERQTVGVLPGQDVFTVDSMAAKLEAQLRGLGVGRLPLSLARPYLRRGELVAKQVQRDVAAVAACYLWREGAGSPPGRALQWWLQQLEHPHTRQALLQAGA